MPKILVSGRADSHRGGPGLPRCGPLAAALLILVWGTPLVVAGDVVPYDPALPAKSLCQVGIERLRPTQFAVGYREVDERAKQIALEPFDRPALDKRLVVDPRALAESFRRIEDLATGRVKGLTEAEFRMIAASRWPNSPPTGSICRCRSIRIGCLVFMRSTLPAIRRFYEAKAKGHRLSRLQKEAKAMGYDLIEHQQLA